MRRATLWRTISVSLLALPVAVAAVFFFLYATPHLDFPTALANIEEVQLQQRSLAPQSLYLRAGRLAGSRDEWLSLFKRLYHFSQQDSFKHYLLATSRQAARSLPQEQSMQAIYLTALLENQQFEQALQQSAQLGPSYNALKAEAWLKNTARTRDLPPREHNLRQLLLNASAENYHQIAIWLNNPHLRYNAALVYLRQGKGELAWQIIQPLLSYPWLPQYVVALIAYDQGQFSQAITHLLAEIDRSKDSPPPHSYQLLADSYLLLGNYASASRYYQRAHEQSGTWQSYYNQAYAFLTLGDKISAFNSLRDGLQRFPDEEQLLIRLVKVSLQEHRNLIVGMINEFRQLYSHNVHVQMLSLIFNSEQLAHPAYLTQLWQLFNYHSENPWIGEYLVWYLLGLNYKKQAQVALERVVHQQQSPPDWSLAYQGMLNLLDGRPGDAYPLLERATKANPSWDKNYNLALAQVQLQQYQQAYQTLQLGLQQQPQSLGVYIKLLQRVGSELGIGKAWQEKIPPQQNQQDPLFDLMEGLYLHDYSQESKTDSDAAPVGPNPSADLSSP